MKQNVSRRNLLKNLSAGMAGVLLAEQSFGRSFKKETFEAPFNSHLALVDPKDAIKITKLEIIPVHSDSATVVPSRTLRKRAGTCASAA